MAGICVCTMHTVHAEGLNLADDNVPRIIVLWNEKHVTFVLIPKSNDTELQIQNHARIYKSQPTDFNDVRVQRPLQNVGRNSATRCQGNPFNYQQYYFQISHNTTFYQKNRLQSETAYKNSHFYLRLPPPHRPHTAVQHLSGLYLRHGTYHIIK